MLQESIGLSVVLGFLVSEFLGISAGGLISPGYLAFYLEQPYRLLSTFILAIITYGVVKLLQQFTIIYARRRFMAAILVSLIVTWIVERNLFFLQVISQDFRFIGYVIPGLIANDMLKQGVFRTLAMTVGLTIIIRLILMLSLFS